MNLSIKTAFEAYSQDPSEENKNALRAESVNELVNLRLLCSKCKTSKPPVFSGGRWKYMSKSNDVCGECFDSLAHDVRISRLCLTCFISTKDKPETWSHDVNGYGCSHMCNTVDCDVCELPALINIKTGEVTLNNKVIGNSNECCHSSINTEAKEWTVECGKCEKCVENAYQFVISN